MTLIEGLARVANVSYVMLRDLLFWFVFSFQRWETNNEGYRHTGNLASNMPFFFLVASDFAFLGLWISHPFLVYGPT